MVSQAACFQACEDMAGCNAVYQYKYSYSSEYRSCYLFSQDDCYDSGSMQADVSQGWETWVFNE
jgi:hypothetical protein